MKKVIYRELGVCEQPITPVTPPMNFSPILRNPIDKINATVGELLIFKVRDVSSILVSFRDVYTSSTYNYGLAKVYLDLKSSRLNKQNLC